MKTRTTTATKRFRIWPGIVFPAGLTLLFALAAWQFAASVTAEQERRNDAAISLAGYARMEAGELSRRARTLSRSFIDNRLAARAEQEKNLRVEIRGVMEAVNKVLGASLERNRARGAARREVSGFPSGFESVKNYLELSRPEDGGDRSAEALHACAPELGNLLPAGCSLSVVENNAVEIFSLGGGVPEEDSLSVAMSREFVWSDGAGEGRRWTLLLKLRAPDRHPVPGAEEIARRLTDEMGGATLENASWRGWLVAANGQPAAVFPAAAGQTEGASSGAAQTAQPPAGRAPPPFTGVPGEWTETDGTSLVWLESAPRPAGEAGRDVLPAIAVAIDRPAPPLDLVEEFLDDTRWICTLGALALGACGFWFWFVRNLLSGRRRAAPGGTEASVSAASPAAPKQRRRPDSQTSSLPPSAGAPSAGADTVAAELRRRLVRDENPRSVSDVEGVIVADIAANGGMTVSNAPDIAAALRQAQSAPPPRPAPLPSGSLFRLQARHRGGKGRQGSRALDRATHPVLKTLAARIRPVVNPGSLSGASAGSGSSAPKQPTRCSAPAAARQI